jgi:hypothetical protein
MKPHLLITVATFMALLFASGVYAQMDAFSEIEYRGQKIKLAHEYSDYDDYKNDKDKILPSELPRLEEMIIKAQIGKQFSDWKSFSHEVFALKVPGFGAGGGPKVKAADSEIIITSVEIPTRKPAEKFRYFVLEKLKDQSLHVVDDFVSNGYPFLAEAIVVNNRIVYRSKDGSVVREVKF